jgi:leader peptidase (prepilin peptidase)/N-methyltransferase
MGPWYLLIGFMAANLLGAAVGVGLILANKARRGTPLPYGVFLAAGSLFALWLGAYIISWYSHHLTR